MKHVEKEIKIIEKCINRGILNKYFALYFVMGVLFGFLSMFFVYYFLLRL
jgi:hypothetical protein